jgi:uncharacterized protein
MAEEHPNAAVVRRLYAAFAARDFPTLRGLFAEDAVWHIPGRSPIAGDYQGPASIIQDFLQRVVSESGGTLQATPIDLLANDHHVVGLQHSTGQRQGKTLDITVCQVFRVQDGRIAEVTTHYSDLYALDAFWSA